MQFAGNPPRCRIGGVRKRRTVRAGQISFHRVADEVHQRDRKNTRHDNHRHRFDQREPALSRSRPAAEKRACRKAERQHRRCLDANAAAPHPQPFSRREQGGQT